MEITASYPTGPIGTTAENLLAAAKGEKEEWDVLYREFAKVAEEEGFIEIATAFKMISTVEAEHERRYLKLLSRLTDGNFFKRQDLVAVPQLRFRHRGRGGSQALPRLQASAGLLRTQEGELLISAGTNTAQGRGSGRVPAFFYLRAPAQKSSRMAVDCGIFTIFAR